ncbi:protein S-acyltransferase [Ranunculus cassubicifolius]
MHGKNCAPPPRTTRVYQSWKGKNKFFFGGRLIFGPDARSLLLTLFLILLPTFLFSALISQTGINDCQHHTCNLLLALSIIFPIHIILLLFLTSARDPGIIPRNAHPPSPEAEAEDDDPGSFMLSIPPTKDVVVNGMVLKVKYCHTCMLYRPPRCSHCSICNNCVERFDHHCPWVGQCIGKRNYRRFFMFVSSTTTYCLYVLVFSCLNLRNITKTHHCNLWRALEKSPVSGILIVYSFIGAWFVGGLTTFHVYLICTNQTTYENFRYRYDRKSNPHNLGVLRNVREIFFSRTPDPEVNFRARLVKLEDNLVKDTPTVDVENRQSVVAHDYEDMRDQMQRVKRCEPEHPDCGELTSDKRALDAEHGIER